jgi:hypothetical protein
MKMVAYTGYPIIFPSETAMLIKHPFIQLIEKIRWTRGKEISSISNTAGYHPPHITGNQLTCRFLISSFGFHHRIILVKMSG